MPPPSVKPTLMKLDQTQFDQYHLLLTHIKDAIQEFTEDNGKWLSILNNTLRDGLAAIALACSTPEDNSEEVKAEIKALTARAKAVADALKGTTDKT
jgi:hypothetical protein